MQELFKLILLNIAKFFANIFLMIRELSGAKENKKEPKSLTKEEELVNNLHILGEKGYDALAVYCQAMLETGSFKYIIGDYNFWGIKVPKKVEWKGKIVKKHIYEKIGKDFVRVDAFFVDFDNIFQALYYYDVLLIQRVYPKAYKVRIDYKKYFKELQKGGYATDDLYAHKLTAIYSRLVNNDKLVGRLIGYKI